MISGRHDHPENASASSRLRIELLINTDYLNRRAI
jgi:hypothetical protein